MIDRPEPDADSQSMALDDERESGPSLISAQLREVLMRHGIPQHRQAKRVSALLDCSYPAARRKIRGYTEFAEAEITAVLASVGATWRGLDIATGESTPSVAAEILIDGAPTACKVTLPPGLPLMPKAARGLALRDPSPQASAAAATRAGARPANLDPGVSYEVVYKTATRSTESNARFLAIRRLEVTPDYGGVRLAILDDEREMRDSLTLIMRRLGFDAAGFASAAELAREIDARPTELAFEAYILDWRLARGQTPAELVRHIRQRDQRAVIIILSGAMAEAGPRRGELFEFVEEMGILSMSKPSHADSLSSIILRGLEDGVPNL